MKNLIIRTLLPTIILLVLTIINTQDDVIAEETTTQEVTTMYSQEQTTELTTEVPTEETTEQPTEEPTVDPDAVTLIGHRGFSKEAPENSVPAMEAAIKNGFSIIEIDLQRTKPDDQSKATWVISHDSSLLSTMGVDKQIEDLTYNQILKYSYITGNNLKKYPNLKIASLEEVIELMKDCKEKGLNITWQLELKEPDSGNNYKEYYEEEIVNPLKEAGVDDCVMFLSFNYSYLKKIKEIDEKIPTWFLSTILSDIAIDKYATECGAEGISFNGSKVTSTKEMAQKALDKGFKLGVYTLDSPVTMGGYYNWGVRYFTTDNRVPKEITKENITEEYDVNDFKYTLSTTSYACDGKEKTPSVYVLHDGQRLIENLNYTIKYKNNKKPGTATVCVSGLNNCRGESFHQYSIAISKACTGITTYTKPTVVEKVIAKRYHGKKRLRIKWKKNTNVTGYQVVIATNKKMTKNVRMYNVAGGKSKKLKIKNLSAKRKYYVKVRAYLIVGEKIYYSKYTKVVKSK